MKTHEAHEFGKLSVCLSVNSLVVCTPAYVPLNTRKAELSCNLSYLLLTVLSFLVASRRGALHLVPYYTYVSAENNPSSESLGKYV
jgi:hypothetical protein